jgi:hypothetical protein
VPVVNSVLNQMPSSALGGYSPITAFTGQAPSSPLDVVFTPDPMTVATIPLSTRDIVDRVSALEKSLSKATAFVREKPTRHAPVRPGQTPIDFDIGDYVLVARGNRTTKDKTAPIWDGPALVVAANNERVFQVKDLLSSRVRAIHADQLKRYSDCNLTVTKQLKNFVAASNTVTNVREIISHRKSGSRWELCVLWEGFEDDESTWQDFKQMFMDVPELVTRYVKCLTEAKVRQDLLSLIAARK